MITFDSFHQPRTEKQREEHEQREQYRQARLQAMREQQDEEAVQEAFAREEKQLQKEREEKNIPKKVTLKNPRWEHIDENARLERPNSVYPELNYSLSIDPGDDGEPYYYFENLLGEQLLEPEKEITRNTN